MPLTIPAFDQYQQPMFPLRGLWHKAPPEGDLFVNAEIDWIVTTKSTAVQFSLSGNSPVAISQIVALSVDNSRSGADVDFVFPDSGFILTVPAHNQLVSPVFTNAMMFYASAPGAIAGDITIFQILNSMPPPVQIAPSSAQNHASVSPIPLQTNGFTQIVPLGVSGTLNSLNINATSAGIGVASLSLADGAGHTLWQGILDFPATGGNVVFPVTGLSARFFNGITLQITSTTFVSGWVTVNLYYSQP
jgi:hypothetical protein